MDPENPFEPIELYTPPFDGYARDAEIDGGIFSDGPVAVPLPAPLPFPSPVQGGDSGGLVATLRGACGNPLLMMALGALVGWYLSKGRSVTGAALGAGAGYLGSRFLCGAGGGAGMSGLGRTDHPPRLRRRRSDY